MKRKLEERFNRILLMVPLILREEGASIDELCEKLEMSRDEIITDLDLLFLCGLPDYGPGDLIDVSIENERIFLSMADYFSKPLRLTENEALALLVAGEALIRANVLKETSAIGKAMEKITRVLGEKEKQDMYDVARRVEVEIESEPGEWWKGVARALEKGMNLALEYYSFSRDEVTQREVEPVSFVFSHGNWYLYGWCHKAQDWRLFRLDRIRGAKLTKRVGPTHADEEVVPPVVGERGADRTFHHVELKLSREAGRRVIEELPDAKSREGEDGKIYVELRTQNLEWLSIYLLKFSGEVEIVSPRELSEMVKKRATEMLEMYEESLTQN